MGHIAILSFCILIASSTWLSLAQGKEWKEAILDRENKLRAIHGSDPLQLLSDLSKTAQKLADRLAEKCEFYRGYPDERKYHGQYSKNDMSDNFGWTGENSIMFANTSTAVKDSDVAVYAANKWYEEGEQYPFKTGGTDGLDQPKETMQFVQQVWKDTKYVGYGYAFNPTCGHFLVAHYYPQGNVPLKFKENVLPPKQDS